MGEAMKDDLATRRARKLKAFEMLAEGKSINEVSRATGANKGSVSRWHRSKEYKSFCEQLEARHNIVDLVRVPKPKHHRRGYQTEAEDPVARGRFIQALRISGRVDVAAAYSQAHPESIAQWLMGHDTEIHAASAEAYLQGVTEIRNIMLAIDKNGNAIEVKPQDRLRAATEYARLTDFGDRRQKEGTVIKLDILKAADEVKAAKKVDPIKTIDKEIQRQLARAVDIDLMVDVEPVE